MYCPQCGQQQISSDMRFCSRCGFPLDGVSMLLATGGSLPVSGSTGEVPAQMSPRRKGVRQGFMLMLIGLILTPILAILTNVVDLPVEIVALTSVIFFWGGILRMLYSLVFDKGAKKSYATTGAPTVPAPVSTPQVAAGLRASILPPAPGQPVGNWRRDTAELQTPPSVTERTTKLLEKADPESGPPAE